MSEDKTLYNPHFQALLLLKKLWALPQPKDEPRQFPLITVDKKSVAFEWWKGSHKLTWYLTEKDMSFIKIWGPDMEKDMQDGSLTPDNIDYLWAWSQRG
jgi:hypothetical protein